MGGGNSVNFETCKEGMRTRRAGLTCRRDKAIGALPSVDPLGKRIKKPPERENNTTCKTKYFNVVINNRKK